MHTTLYLLDGRVEFFFRSLFGFFFRELECALFFRLFFDEIGGKIVPFGISWRFSFVSRAKLFNSPLLSYMVYPHTVCGWVHDPGGLYKELDFPWLYPVNPGTLRKYISTYVLIVVTLISRVLLYIVFCEFQYPLTMEQKIPRKPIAPCSKVLSTILYSKNILQLSFLFLCLFEIFNCYYSSLLLKIPNIFYNTCI